ncbi:MAG: GNAT family N-acetyltransferase [Cyanobacteria bacterium]|nr:GNAT family N-acetyltransferase [Cyanobacteriota bacterium]
MGPALQTKSSALGAAPSWSAPRAGGRITAPGPPPLAAPTPPLQIRPYEPADWPQVWTLLEPVFRAGETFPHDPAITEDGARAAWVKQSQAVMVAADAALGAHVANAGYVVAERCRSMGIGSRLCQHSLQAARRLSFRLMQFNLVVSTNTAVLRCWQRNGFQVVGTLPGAFHQRQLVYVDALVMIQSLIEEAVR